MPSDNAGGHNITIRIAAPDGLPPGVYSLTIMVQDAVLGRKTFIIGMPQG